MTEPAGRVFRPGATVPLLFVWAALTGASAGFLIQHALRLGGEPEAKTMAWLLAVISILVGPVPFFIHFVRLCLVWVSVEEGGLLLSNGRAINWHEVRSVEQKDGAFKGLLRPNPLIFLLSAGSCALVYYVILPAVALLTPWHPRVIVTLTSGETLVFRDLMNATTFVREVDSRKSGGTPRGQG